MTRTLLRLAVCAPQERLVYRAIARIGAELSRDYGSATVTGGVLERGSSAFEKVRQAAPESPCWALLDSMPDTILVVVYADVAVLN